jgi:hypothetical protein
MGTWGAGNFESDTALDFLGRWGAQLEKQLIAPSSFMGIEKLMAVVEIWLALLQRQPRVPLVPPKRSNVESLREQVLIVFDREVALLSPKGNFASERRDVIKRSFDTLAAVGRDD